MTVPERVAHFLKQNRHIPYCDGCVHKRLKLARHQQAQQATSSLGATREFTRQAGTCADCGRHLTVTRAN